MGKSNLKTNFAPNGLETYMSFTINNKLSFINSFRFLSSSLDSLVKNLSKDDFKYLSQKFDNNILDLVNQKGFYPYEYMNDFGKFKGELPSKEKFYSSLTGRKINDKEHEPVLDVWNKFNMRTMKDYHDDDVFGKFRNESLNNYGLCLSHFQWTRFKLGCNSSTQKS